MLNASEPRLNESGKWESIISIGGDNSTPEMKWIPIARIEKDTKGECKKAIKKAVNPHIKQAE